MELERLTKAIRNFEIGNITPEDYTVILETLKQVEMDRKREEYKKKISDEDYFDYLETHRGKKR